VSEESPIVQELRAHIADRQSETGLYPDPTQQIAKEVGRLACTDPDAAKNIIDTIKNPSSRINAMVRVADTTGDFELIIKAVATVQSEVEEPHKVVKLNAIARRVLDMGNSVLAAEIARDISDPRSRATLLLHILLHGGNPELASEVDGISAKLNGWNVDTTLAKWARDNQHYRTGVNAMKRASYHRTKVKWKPISNEEADYLFYGYVGDCIKDTLTTDDCSQLLPIASEVASALKLRAQLDEENIKGTRNQIPHKRSDRDSITTEMIYSFSIFEINRLINTFYIEELQAAKNLKLIVSEMIYGHSQKM
jgi:hypothetical protein